MRGDIWAEMFAISGPPQLDMKVWFHRNKRQGWCRAGSLQYSRGQWRADGIGKEVLRSLRDGQLSDDDGVLSQAEPQRVFSALEVIYEGPEKPATPQWNA